MRDDNTERALQVMEKAGENAPALSQMASLAEVVEGMEVSSQEQYEAAAAVLGDVLDWQGRIHEEFDQSCSAAYKAHRTATSLRKKALGLLPEIEKSLREKLNLFDPEQEAPGFELRESWGFEVVDPNLLPIEYLAVDEKAIRAVVNRLGDRASIPGVEVKKRRVISRQRKEEVEF